jgi:hypothetical protein
MTGIVALLTVAKPRVELEQIDRGRHQNPRQPAPVSLSRVMNRACAARSGFQDQLLELAAPDDLEVDRRRVRIERVPEFARARDRRLASGQHDIPAPQPAVSAGDPDLTITTITAPTWRSAPTRLASAEPRSSVTPLMARRYAASC